MTEELKNKIRRERILETIENSRINYNYNECCNFKLKNNAYYKSLNQFSLKDVTEENIVDSKNEKIKKDCIDFMNKLNIFKVEYIDKLTKYMKEMSIDEILLHIYHNFLFYQITRINKLDDYSVFNNMTLDDMEEMLDEIIANKEKNNAKKNWWNIF